MADRTRRYHTGAYRAWQLHVGTLLTEAGLSGHLAPLAPLASDLFAHQRASGRTPDDIAADLAILAPRIFMH